MQDLNLNAMPKYQFTCEAQPQYLPEQSAPEDHVFVFAYTITITNAGDVTAQLISRHWIISDANGHNEEVKGLGVVGQQPLLKPGESFQYTSGSRLRTASGAMHGSYFCVAEDGGRFEAPIPMFVLEATPDAPTRVLH
jgi:ApaG protein